MDIEQKARTAAGIYKINQSNLGTVPIPVPDPHTQRWISTWLDQSISEVNKCITVLRHRLEAINALPGSLLRQAFAGKL
jgi:restriction endonuclease S subunit